MNKEAIEVLKKYELFNYRDSGLDETHIYLDNAISAMEEYAEMREKEAFEAARVAYFGFAANYKYADFEQWKQSKNK